MNSHPKDNKKSKMGAVQFSLFYTLVFAILTASSANGRTILRSAPQMCPIEDGNLLEVKLFVKDGNLCYDMCEKNRDCQFFR